ncbi:MAG: hypothetical protein DRO11_04385 [Methanobacteriota archaeon]|nr:MAG: hypothetical protein DRO11_04385 [Euryarchaeota archaeon]
MSIVPQANDLRNLSRVVVLVAGGLCTSSKICEVWGASIDSVQNYLEAGCVFRLVKREKKGREYCYSLTEIGNRFVHADEQMKTKLLQERLFEFEPFLVVAKCLSVRSRNVTDVGKTLMASLGQRWSFATASSKAGILLSWGVQLRIFHKRREGKRVVYHLTGEGRNLLRRRVSREEEARERMPVIMVSRG